MPSLTLNGPTSGASNRMYSSKSVWLTDHVFASIYIDIENSNYQTIVIGDVSSGTLVLGTPVVISTYGQRAYAIERVSDTQFVVCYWMSSSSSRIMLVSVSGVSLTLSTSEPFLNQPYSPNINWIIGNTYVITFGGGSKLHSTAMTIDPIAETIYIDVFNDNNIFRGSYAYFVNAVKLGDNSVACIFHSNGAGTGIFSVIVSITGTTVTFGPPLRIDTCSLNDVDRLGITTLESDSKVLFAWVKNTGTYPKQVQFQIGNISGTTITLASSQFQYTSYTHDEGFRDPFASRNLITRDFFMAATSSTVYAVQHSYSGDSVGFGTAYDLSPSSVSTTGYKVEFFQSDSRLGTLIQYENPFASEYVWSNQFSLSITEILLDDIEIEDDVLPGPITFTLVSAETEIDTLIYVEPVFVYLLGEEAENDTLVESLIQSTVEIEYDTLFATGVSPDIIHVSNIEIENDVLGISFRLRPIEAVILTHLNTNTSFDWYYPRALEQASMPYGIIEVITNETRRYTQFDKQTYSGRIRVNIQIHSKDKYQLADLIQEAMNVFDTNMVFYEANINKRAFSPRVSLKQLDSNTYFTTQDVTLDYYTTKEQAQ